MTKKFNFLMVLLGVLGVAGLSIVFDNAWLSREGIPQTVSRGREIGKWAGRVVPVYPRGL